MMMTKPEVADLVSCYELAALKRDRDKLEAMRIELEVLAKSIHEREQDVIARIESGVPVDGLAKVVDRRRQNVSWLTVVKRELGEAAVIKVKDEWPLTFTKELLIA